MSSVIETPEIEAPAAPAASHRKNIQRMAIVVRADRYGRLLTPLTFAIIQASQRVQVDMLFVLWAARVLTKDEAKAVPIDGRHVPDEAALRACLATDGDPVEIYDGLQILKRTGNASLYACRLAATTFDVSILEADGIVEAVWRDDAKTT